MTRPPAADKGNGLQVWRVDEDILNQYSPTACNGVAVQLRVGYGASNSPTLKLATSKNAARKFWLGTDCLGRSEQRKMNTIYETWHVRSLCVTGSLKTVARDNIKIGSWRNKMGSVWTGYVWLRIVVSGGFYWKRYWTFGFHILLTIFWVSGRLLASEERLICLIIRSSVLLLWTR
jgi:hypothetical protein